MSEVEIDETDDCYTVTLWDGDMCIASVWDFATHAAALAHAKTLTTPDHIVDYTDDANEVQQYE